MESFPLGCFVLIGVLVIAGAIYAHYAAQRRQRALAAWAAARGWSFSARRIDYWDRLFPGFECLAKGHRRYAFNLGEGRLGQWPVRTFDYHYETYSQSKHGRQTHHHYFSGVIVTTGLPLRPLFIRPEGFFDKVTEFLGYDDIDFESDEFSRRFYVKAPDRRWAYDVISQPTMEFLLANPRFTLQFHGTSVIAYRGKTFEIPEFEAAIGLIQGILERLPSSLVRELREGRPPA